MAARIGMTLPSLVDMSRRFGRNRCFWFLKVGVLETDISWFPRNFGAIYQTERCHIPEPHKWVRCRDIVVISDDRPVTNRTFERSDLAAYLIYGFDSPQADFGIFAFGPTFGTNWPHSTCGLVRRLRMRVELYLLAPTHPDDWMRTPWSPLVIMCFVRISEQTYHQFNIKKFYVLPTKCMCFVWIWEQTLVTICTTMFNIQKFYVLPTQCTYVSCVDLRTNSGYYMYHHV